LAINGDPQLHFGSAMILTPTTTLPGGPAVGVDKHDFTIVAGSHRLAEVMASLEARVANPPRHMIGVPVSNNIRFNNMGFGVRFPIWILPIFKFFR